MSAGLEKLRRDRRVEIVDDERRDGGNLVVTMQPGWTIDPLVRHAGVFGADTLTEAWKTLRSAKLFKEAPVVRPSSIVHNPLLGVPEVLQAVEGLDADQRETLRAMLNGIRKLADEKAAACLAKNKWTLFAYWKCVGVYANHMQRAVAKATPRA